MTEGRGVGRGTAWVVSALGLMPVVQDAGISAANLIAGGLNDRAAARSKRSRSRADRRYSQPLVTVPAQACQT